MICRTFWITGLSGAGKSTICQAAFPLLTEKGLAVKILDGDEVRATYQRPVGFTYEDVLLNNLHICELIEGYLGKNQDVILVPTISPYKAVRQRVAKQLGGRIYFIYCNASMDTVSKRDTKKLYSLEKRGKILDLIGVSKGYPYEIPLNPALVLNTNDGGLDEINKCAEKLVKFILKKLDLDDYLRDYD